MLTSLTQVHEELHHLAARTYPPLGHRKVNLNAETAVLYSGGLESTHLFNTLAKSHGAALERFRVSMLLDTRRYGIILPAVVQARFYGYKEVIISDDQQDDAPYYVEQDTEILLTPKGRVAASQLLGINVISNSDWGLTFDKWAILPKKMRVVNENRPIVSCFEQEYEFWELHNHKAKPCGHCKKCFHIHTLQMAKYGESDTPIDDSTWERYCLQAITGLRTKTFTYALGVFHTVQKNNGWDQLLSSISETRWPAFLPVRIEFRKRELRDARG